MNRTLLALLSVLSIYGLSSLALSRPDVDLQDDSLDIQAGDVTGSSSLPPKDDEPNAET